MASQEGGSNISMEEINTDLDSNNNIADDSITIEIGEGLPNKVERLHKVPKTLMKPFLEFFEPRGVSLGLYHHNVEHLLVTADDKHKIKNYLLQDRNKKVEDFDKEMNFALKDKRDLYVKDSMSSTDKKKKDSMSSEEFNETMILDACFIIHIVDYVSKIEKTRLGIKIEKTRLGIKPHLLPLVVEDIFLLENQVPFAVLKAAMESLGENPKEMTRQFFLNLSISEIPSSTRGFFFKFNYSHWIIRCIMVVPMLVMCIMSLPKKVRRLKRQLYLRDQRRQWNKNRDRFWEGGENVHLLQFLRADLLSYASEKKSELLSYLWRPTRCATELKATGINFRKRESHIFSVEDVKFKEGLISGHLLLPSINQLTKRRLLNLIAYELSSEHCGYGITSYVSFLDGLIDRPEDVKELRSKNILPKGLGSDEEVAEFFNMVGTDLALDSSAYDKVLQDIEAHCRDTWRADIADIRHKYFSSHSNTISFLIAAFLFLITLAQAYTTFFTKKK